MCGLAFSACLGKKPVSWKNDNHFHREVFDFYCIENATFRALSFSLILAAYCQELSM